MTIVPPAVFFSFVKPTRTQKPMKRTRTKMALDVNPARAPTASR